MTEIVPTIPISEAEKSLPEDPNAPRLGRWYYVECSERDDEGHVRGKFTELGCVTAFGSNYIELTDIAEGTRRVHVDEFDEKCAPADDAADVIARRIARHKGNVQGLLRDVRDITAQLGVSTDPTLGPGETHAISIRGSDSDERIKEYQTALVTAKDKTIPALFKQIERENARLARWMNAELIPLKAETGKLQESIGAIKRRIFSVELYAGLCEKVYEITPPDAKPAPIQTPIHLMQRRCYMDEECLIDYDAGGMNWASVHGFFDWLARPHNRDRILPHPRCIVAFRIRRHEKAYNSELYSFIQIGNMHEADKATFLFIRNGEKLFCLETKIDFPEQLFPHGSQASFVGELWAHVESTGHVHSVITRDQHEGLIEERKALIRRYKAFRRRTRGWSEERLKKEPDWWEFRWGPSQSREDDPRNYVRCEPNHIYYDDIIAFVQDKVNEHNQLVLVLQGLLDRSPVLHPHPRYRLWEGAGFQQAIRLVYDDSLALAPSETPPDFEAYRARLNASIKVGTVVMGQYKAWCEDKEEARNAKFYEFGYNGPKNIGRVHKLTNKRGGGRTADFLWKRERRRAVWRPVPDRPGYIRRVWPDIAKTFTCSVEQYLFNLDAYTPGDYRQFFDDPRTRQQYLKWAPFLLTGEDYKAGKRKVKEEKEGDDE